MHPILTVIVSRYDCAGDKGRVVIPNNALRAVDRFTVVERRAEILNVCEGSNSSSPGTKLEGCVLILWRDQQTNLSVERSLTTVKEALSFLIEGSVSGRRMVPLGVENP